MASRRRLRSNSRRTGREARRESSGSSGEVVDRDILPLAGRRVAPEETAEIGSEMAHRRAIDAGSMGISREALDDVQAESGSVLPFEDRPTDEVRT